MSPMTSKLWTRRMTNRVQETPILSPLYSTALCPTSAFPTDCTPTTLSRSLLSSPSLYTPTEAIGILLGQSPIEAAQSTRLAIEAITSTLPLASPCSKHRYHSSPCSPNLDSHRLGEVRNGEEYSSFLLRSLSYQQTEFNLDIDTAALATEVALKVLSSGDCYGEQEEQEKAGRQSLILFGDPVTTIIDTIDQEKTASVEVQSDAGEKPIRKGRARMSQEKRKRLARRKEREAMLMGIPPKPVSAPPHISHFPSLPPDQLPRNHSGWKHTKLSWTQDPKKQPSGLRQTSLARSGSLSDEYSSRESACSVPSLVGDDGHPSPLTASPLTSPECSRRSRFPNLRVDQGTLPWNSSYLDTPVPRLSVQPPSPQQSRTLDQRRRQSFPVPFVTPTTVNTVAPMMMRWSTTQGLMTSQGIPLNSPRAVSTWPAMFPCPE